MVQGDTNSSSALDVVFFVREIMETNPKLRPTILARLLDTFSQIRSSPRLLLRAVDPVPSNCTSPQDIDAALEVRCLPRYSTQVSCYAMIAQREHQVFNALSNFR